MDLEEETLRIINNLQKNTEDMDSLKSQLVSLWKEEYLNVKKVAAPCVQDIKIIKDCSDSTYTSTTLYLIAHYLLRQGDLEILECLIKEYEESKTQPYFAKNGKIRDNLISIKENYLFLVKSIEEIKIEKFDNLNSYIQKNTKYFSENSELLFILYCVEFLILIKNKKVKESVFFLREKMKSFYSSEVDCFGDENREKMEKNKFIRQLLNFLAFKKDSSVLLQECIDKLINRFELDFSILEGFPRKCPLTMLFNSGVSAIPELVKATINYSKKDILEMEEKEIPVELLPKKNFHSLFVCPVLKVLCGEENPPVLLECGHVISQEAVNRLSKDGMTYFKCPYCPQECRCFNCKILYL